MKIFESDKNVLEESETKNITKNNSKAEVKKNLPENYLATSDAIMMAIDSSEVQGALRNCIYYDKRKKMFLAVDMYGVSDWTSKSEKKLREKILENPQRFIKFPQFTSSDNWAIMHAFAEEKEDEELIEALNGDGAFSEFYDKINARNLNEKFGEFQANYYNEIFKKWYEDNNIAEKIQF